MTGYRYTLTVRAFIAKVEAAILASGYGVASVNPYRGYTSEKDNVYYPTGLKVHAGRSRSAAAPLSALGVLVQTAEYSDEARLLIIERLTAADPTLSGDLSAHGYKSMIVIAPSTHWANKEDLRREERVSARTFSVTMGLVPALTAMIEAESSEERLALATLLVPQYNMTLTRAKMFLTSEDRNERTQMARALPVLKPLLDSQATAPWATQLPNLQKMDVELIQAVTYTAFPDESEFEYQSLRLLKSTADTTQISAAKIQIAQVVAALTQAQQYANIEDALSCAKWCIERLTHARLKPSAFTADKPENAGVIMRRVYCNTSPQVTRMLTRALQTGSPVTFEDQLSIALTHGFRTMVLRALATIAWKRLGWAPDITLSETSHQHRQKIATELMARLDKIPSCESPVTSAPLSPRFDTSPVHPNTGTLLSRH